MKKLTAILLALLMLCLAALALAEGSDWGMMTIDGHDADRVHLRGAPSTDARSLGLYFTGTQVECLSDPTQEWVDVKIGTESGFIRSEYLTAGSVTAAFPVGVVSATGLVNFRVAPATQYEILASLRDGTPLIVYGETVDHWYYVAYGLETGYIKADYVALGEPTPVNAPAVNTGMTTVTFDLEDSVMAYVRAANCLVYVHGTDDDFITVTYDPALLRLDASTARGTNILFFESATGTPMLEDVMGAHVYLPKGYYHSVYLDVPEGIGYLNGAVDADFTIYGSQGEVHLDLPTYYAHQALISLSRSTMSVSLSEALTDYAIRFGEITGSVIDVSQLTGVPPLQPGETSYDYSTVSDDSGARLVFDIVRDSTVEFAYVAARLTDDP